MRGNWITKILDRFTKVTLEGNKTHSIKDAWMKFVKYLVKEGKIDESELEDALKFQLEIHINLGVLAVRENLLNNNQGKGWNKKNI